MAAKKTILASAHGKINWTLDILARRGDGYHEMASIMQRIDLADRLSFTRGDSGIRLSIVGPEAKGVPDDERNIVWKAAELLGVNSVDIVIEKHLPNQAGLGGGSSDAAAALLALNELFSLDLMPKELADTGAKLGADVSFFLAQSPARIGGFGEQVTPIKTGKNIDIVVLKPEVGVSTAAAYNALDNRAGRISGSATELWPNIAPSNDFEDVVFDLYPAVAKASETLLNAGAIATLLCGSGGAVMGWGPDINSIFNNVQQAGQGKVWLTRTI
jgi:4-diphosphocytidyl-2-C-methyl-D-erythritol kinase